MKKGIFRRIFIVYTVIALAFGILTEIYITAAVRENYISNLRQNLENEIGLFSKGISFGKGNIDSICRETKQVINARVTVIRSDGTVIGDSDHDSATMDNHSDRTEIQQASDHGSGMTVRYSQTMKHDFLYVAKKITERGQVDGFIRLAVPLVEVNRSVNMLRMKILFVVIAVIFITWGVATWQTDHLRRLLMKIVEFSRSLSKGEIEKRLFLGDAGEFNEIADNLTMMSATLKSVLSQAEEERDRLNVILRSVPDALLIIDAKGFITLSSLSARDFFGEASAAGRHFAEIVRSHEFTELIDDVRKSRAPGMAEFIMEIPAEKHMSVRVSPLFYGSSELSGFVAVFHDITEIKKLDQVRKDFVANVSHELKTPITAIKGFADTLIDGALDDRENAMRFVQTIKSNSERINALVDDLMTISKIELGVIKVEKTLIDIDDVFESVTELFSARAASKNIEIRILRQGEMLQIEADRNRLIQILANLVDNALKFTETGCITIGADKTEERTPYLFVEDTGTGIPEKFLSRLGERFFRVDPARSRNMGGTGLGLAIVKHLVKAHGWSMKFESQPAKGTKVKIFI